MEAGELIAGRYELSKRLGRGGMGEVWAARDRSLRRDVALKLLHLDSATRSELPQRFEREAVAAAQINHPNVAALYDRGVHEDMLFIAMEKVDGATLTEHIRAEKGMPLARALQITEEICAALVAAHRAHVIHYDIKPHNVMISSDGRVKVVDFGIAGFAQTVFSVARSSQLAPAGTPEYGAPEQFFSERGDERSDLYALGGVLFALLIGRPPFTGHNGIAVVWRKREEEAPRLDSLRPGVPTEVTALVAELLQRDPRQRPQSAGQVLERLQQLQAGLYERHARPTVPSAAVPSPPPPPPTQNVVGGQQLLRGSDPFTISWTGKEPLSRYSAAPSFAFMARHYAFLLFIALVGVYLLFWAGRSTLPAPQDHQRLVATLVLSSTLGLFVILRLTLEAVRRYKQRPASWTLRIGPSGIETRSDFDRREYSWSEVQDFIITPIHALQRRTGLHLKFRSGSKLRHAYDAIRPTGCPPHRTAGGISNSFVPVCILGPMNDQQKAEMIEALAHYSQQS